MERVRLARWQVVLVAAWLLLCAALAYHQVWDLATQFISVYAPRYFPGLF